MAKRNCLAIQTSLDCCCFGFGCFGRSAVSFCFFFLTSASKSTLSFVGLLNGFIKQLPAIVFEAVKRAGISPELIDNLLSLSDDIIPLYKKQCRQSYLAIRHCSLLSINHIQFFHSTTSYNPLRGLAFGDSWGYPNAIAAIRSPSSSNHSDSS